MSEAVMWVAYANMLKIMNDMLKQRRPQPQPCPPCQECPECPEPPGLHTTAPLIDATLLNGSSSNPTQLTIPQMPGALGGIIMLESYSTGTTAISLAAVGK